MIFCVFLPTEDVASRRRGLSVALCGELVDCTVDPYSNLGLFLELHQWHPVPVARFQKILKANPALMENDSLSSDSYIILQIELPVDKLRQPPYNTNISRLNRD